MRLEKAFALRVHGLGVAIASRFFHQREDDGRSFPPKFPAYGRNIGPVKEQMRMLGDLLESAVGLHSA